MSSIRKVLWPTALALGLLVFLGALSAPRSAYAAEVAEICGPEIISVDETALYVALIEDEDVENDYDVDLDDVSGNSDITSFVEEDPDDEFAYVDGLETDFLQEVDDIDADEMGDAGDAIDDVEAEFDINLFEFFFGGACSFYPAEEDLAADILEALIQCLDVDTCDDIPTWDDVQDEVDLDVLADEMAAILFGDPELIGESCFDGFHDEVEDFLILNGVNEDTAADAANQFCQFLDGGDFDELFDGLALVVVDVTCEEAGEFELSVAPEENGSVGIAGSIEVKCVGEVDEGLITATPTKVEIVPAQGSVSYSLIVVELLDEDGEPVLAGAVDFNTDRCEFKDEDGIGDLETLKGALDVFADYDPNDPDSAVDVHDFVDANIEDDPDDVSNEVASFMLDDDAGDFDEGDTLAAIVLDCSDEDTVPGTAEVCFQVDQEGGDVMGCVKVTVVGPPAKVTAAAAPTTLICGEKATITVTVKDSADQNVSDHTRVEAVTNLGGVLAGTGAVAGQAGLVVPISSTVAETFNGVATFYLLTSDAHAGPYEVVIATGGSGSVNTGLGGVFSTPPQVTQVTVTCSQPVVAAPAAPTVTAPSTGTGSVSPPNTGDGGLVADQTSAGFSWALVAVAGVLAFSVAGLATLKISRR